MIGTHNALPVVLLPLLAVLGCAGEPVASRPPSCMDGAKNGAETDVDCGGPCVPCANGATCQGPADCVSRVCQEGACRPAACSDGVRNGPEVDVDCGGGCAACGDGKGCGRGADCASGVCQGGVCQAPTCSDGVRNGGEADVDCGGPCAGCGLGRRCRETADCAGSLCEGATCRAAESCAVLLRARPGAQSGTYPIDPDGYAQGNAPFLVRCEMTIDGGGWTRFNWVLEAYPAGQDPLGQLLRECDPAANICRGRIPEGVNPTALMVREAGVGQWAAWRFDGNSTGSVVLAALRDKQQVCRSNSGVNWQPYSSTASRTFCGNGGEGGCDSFYYLEGGCNAKPANGWGLQLDGDTGCANAAFKMGSTSVGCGASGGTDDYGFLTFFEYKQVFGELFYR